MPLAETRAAYEEAFRRLQSGSRSLEELGVPIADAKKLVQEGLERADVASVLSRDERVVKLLARVGGSRKQFLITGSAEAEAHKKLEALDIRPGAFALRLYAYSPHNNRLDGSAYRHVAEELGIPLHQLMFVGDRESVDILPAKALGLKTAIVNAISPHADYQLNQIYDLEELLL